MFSQQRTLARKRGYNQKIKEDEGYLTMKSIPIY